MKPRTVLVAAVRPIGRAALNELLWPLRWAYRLAVLGLVAWLACRWWLGPWIASEVERGVSAAWHAALPSAGPSWPSWLSGGHP